MSNWGAAAQWRGEDSKDDLDHGKSTGSVFDGGGDLVLDRDMLKRGLISGW